MNFSTTAVTLLDGAMGTMLEREGVDSAAFYELDRDTRFDILTRIHRGYLNAGAQVIYANTFRANRRMLSSKGLAVDDVVRDAVQAAKCAAADFPSTLVALDIGPLDSLVEPLGSIKFADAVDIFTEIAQSGEKAGADLAVIETIMDLQEARAALLAVKEHTALPVMVSMSFDASGRTPLGCPVAAFVRTISDMGADAVGFNCSVGPEEMANLVSEARGLTALPLIAKSNAGLPDPVTGEYRMTPEDFARGMRKCVEAGASLIGGCCGTSPEYIAALRPLKDAQPGEARADIPAGLCSATKFVPLQGVRAIGERINPTGKKRLQQALLEQDLDHIVALAVQQMDAGADFLDINVGHPGVDEAALLPRVVMAVQAVTDLPLVIDSTNARAIEAALRVCCGKAAVNSVNGKMEVMAEILPVVKKYGASVIGLTLGEQGLPATAGERIAIAEAILDQTRRYLIPDRDLWIDCLTLTLSAQQEQARHTLAALRHVREALGLHTVLGVSNISFGLPARPTLTAAFLMAAMASGLSLAIVNPNRENMDAITAWRALHGDDPSCAGYIARFAAASAAPAPASAGVSLTEAIARGMKAEAARLAREALDNATGLAIVETALIPALDQVGADYGAGKAFLPQLLSAAGAAQAVFEVIREVMAGKGEAPVRRGKVVLATVRGDIHDIGKDIVKTVLENYGYQVVDLGKAVPTEAILSAADAPVVGLSALMTTTLPAMEEAVRALKALPKAPFVIVGGAVVTADYAAQIGADAYAEDARAAAQIVKSVLG